MKAKTCLLVIWCLVFPAGTALANPGVRRFALAAGANDGGADRAVLRYAVSDAESFARVIETMGGVDAADLLLLRQPSLIELEDALEDLRHRVSMAAKEGERTQVIVYFSGHANEVGLILGEELFSYRALRNWMDLVEADVRIAVLDACASGSITRLKGPRRRSAFLVDTPAEMQGYAFLTSSSADEVAQESDRIGASFFTHYLVSGLRGAADLSGEGRVTLGEAYQFAFNETLSRTTETRAGAQHPSYDINLSGAGEVVMTDVRETSALLVLGEPLRGTFFVRDDEGRVVAELNKPGGRSVELGLVPGTYEVWRRDDSGSSVSKLAIEENGRYVLDAGSLTATDEEPVLLRGDEVPANPFGSLDGKWRIGFRLGGWQHGGMGSAVSDYLWDRNNTTGGVTVAYWLRDDLSVDFTAWSTMYLVKSENPRPDDELVAALQIGMRKYFPGLLGLRPTIRPFVSAAGGPYYRQARLSSDDVTVPGGPSDAELIRGLAAGGNVGGGVAVQVARWGMVDATLGYTFTSDFEDDSSGVFGGKTSYSGFDFAMGFSVVFGKGSSPDR